jgi:hypothetical protein
MTYPSSVSREYLRRFSQVATITDEKGFIKVFEQLIAERRANSVAVNLPADTLARAKSRLQR